MDFYYSFAFNKSKKHKLRFGQALIFWTGLIHCVPENQEKKLDGLLTLDLKIHFHPMAQKVFQTILL